MEVKTGEEETIAPQIQRKCRDAANDQYASTAALTFLSQNESVQATNENDSCSHLSNFPVVDQRRATFPPKITPHGTQMQLSKKFKCGLKVSK